MILCLPSLLEEQPSTPPDKNNLQFISNKIISQGHTHQTKDLSKRHHEKRKESRGEFEKRVKRELQELINNRMQNLVTSQTEATKVTADAAKQLVELHKAMQSQNTKV